MHLRPLQATESIRSLFHVFHESRIQTMIHLIPYEAFRSDELRTCEKAWFIPQRQKPSRLPIVSEIKSFFRFWSEMSPSSARGREISIAERKNEPRSPSLHRDSGFYGEIILSREARKSTKAAETCFLPLLYSVRDDTTHCVALKPNLAHRD